MSEFISSKKIQATDSANININVKKSPVNIPSNVPANTRLPEEKGYEDKLNLTNPVKTNSESKPQQNPFLTKGTTNLPVINTFYANLQQIMNPLNQMQLNSQQLITNFLSRFVNIMDKISAVFGDKEKDIRELLSNTFKRLEAKAYMFLGKVDTAMEQKDHHKEKKIRDPEDKKSDKNSNTKRID